MSDSWLFKNFFFTIVISLILWLPFSQLFGQETNQTSTVPTSTDQLLSTTTADEIKIPELVLKPGMRKGEIRKLQEILRFLGFFPESLRITDFFGPQTRNALLKFQKSQNLPATGVFDEATRIALRNYLQKRAEVRKQKIIEKPLEPLKLSIGDFFKSLTSTLDSGVSTTCMKLAIEKRENSLLTAWENYSSKVKTAYETRKADFLAAWSIQDARQRQEAIKTAWLKYRENIIKAHTEWNQAKKETWLTFTQEAKNCRALVIEPSSLEEIESQTQ